VRSQKLSALAVGLVFVLAACGGAPPGNSLAPGVTPGPGQTPTRVPPPVGGTGTECAGIPTIAQTPQPTFVPPRDPVLEARIPQVIDGQPVTGVNSLPFLYFVCAFFGQEGASIFVGALPGINVATISYATAKATVDGRQLDVQVLRAPGLDATVLAQALVRVNAAFNEDPVGTLSPITLGGKNGWVAKDADGNVDSYSYVSGDVLFLLNDADETEAAVVFAALP
jgi:hypothetical protein